MRFLGRGGAGEVWETEAPGGVAKAIKITLMDLSDDTLVRREMEGLQKIRSIRHPFLLAIDRYEVVDGLLIIVMELADNSLFDRLNECRQNGLYGIPRAEVLAYLKETAEVLDKLNREHGLQHLDVKPTNIMLSSGHVKVADFGLLQAADADLSQTALALSPGYAPPELFNGKIDPTADQYALAVTYVELLTGRRPYPATSIIELISQLSERDPDLAGLEELDRAVIRKALHSDPMLRFRNCSDLVAALVNPEAFSKSQPRLMPTARRPGDSGRFSTGTSGIFRALVPSGTDLKNQRKTPDPDEFADADADTVPNSHPGGVKRSADSWPNVPPGATPGKARPLFVKGTSQKPEKPKAAKWQVAAALFPSPTSSIAVSDSRVAHHGGSVAHSDELHDTFLASLPLEIYALKLRGLLDSLEPEIITCSEKETVFGFLQKGWFSFSPKTGIYVRIETVQHNPESHLRVVDVAVWSTSKTVQGEDLGQMSTMLIRLIKSFMMANDQQSQQTFDMAKIKNELWKR